VTLLCAQGALTGDLHLLRVVLGLIITRGENIDAERRPQDGVSAARFAASRPGVAAGLLSELCAGFVRRGYQQPLNISPVRLVLTPAIVGQHWPGAVLSLSPTISAGFPVICKR
jgi:hypothetical protein